MLMQKTILALAIATVAGIGTAQAAPVASGGNFEMRVNAGLDTAGLAGGGSFVNNDTTIAGFVDQAAGTWGVSSTAAFFGFVWTASGGTLITGAGTYNLDTATGAVTSIGTCTVANDANLCFTIGAGQIAGAIDFAWQTTTGIRVVNVWNVNGDGSLTTSGVPGMENGPFPNYNAAFNLSAPGLYTPVAPVPIPAAVWLLGSGLLGLVGVARRRKALVA